MKLILAVLSLLAVAQAFYCSAPKPIRLPNSTCTDQIWIEPIYTMPSRFRSHLGSEWTKWIRAAVPVVGKALTQDAALFEVAYFVNHVQLPGGVPINKKILKSMLWDKPTVMQVWPACPQAYMHPAIFPKMSTGGGGDTVTLVSEDWVLRYPTCAGQYAVACDQMPLGVYCNNCNWNDPSIPIKCQDTMAHEYGHTVDLHERTYMNSTIDQVAIDVFGPNAPYPIEGPAWAAGQFWMNPSLETNAGRSDCTICHKMPLAWENYWRYTHGFEFTKYASWRYILKTKRCPSAGLLEACPDSLTRNYKVPLDNFV